MRFLLFILFIWSPLSAAQLKVDGLPREQAKEALEALQGRFFYIKNRPATASRADDAAFLLREYLRQHGAPNATVTWFLPGADTIQLKVAVGQLRFLSKVSIEGWPEEDSSEAQQQFTSAFLTAGNKIPYHPSAAQEGVGRVIDLLKSKSYWNAQVETRVGALTPASDLPVTLLIKPGPRFTLKRPLISSSIPPQADLIQQLDDLKGQAATTENINRIRFGILRHYRKNGYPDASLVQNFKFQDQQLLVSLTLTPGNRYTLRNIHVTGLQKTNPNAILKPLKQYQGKPYDEDHISKRIKKLIATGAFNRVQFEETPLNNGQLDATLHLQEAKARGISLSGGVGSYETFILGAQYFDRNLSGSLHNLNAGLEFTSLGILGEVSLQNPFFLGRDLNFTQRAYIITRDFDGYSKNETGFGLELTLDQYKHYSATFGFQGTFASISPDGLPIASLGPRDYFVTTLSFNQRYDRRDDPTLPSDGWYAELNTSLGLALRNNSVPYFSAEGKLSYYDTRGSDSAIALNLRSGFIIPSGRTSELPIDLRQFEGGAQSIRSFNERDLGPSVNGFPTGGTAWWIANAEYIRTITGPVKAVAFLDAGSLSAEPGDLFSSEVEVAVGLGLRIDLPVGPVRFEYGHSLTQDQGEHSGAFHFSIGATF